MPQGVTPPAQLLMVPNTLVPVGSAMVLKPGVAGSGAGDLHLGVGGDAAVVLAVGHHRHLPFVLADLDDRAAVGRHLDVDLLLGERRDRRSRLRRYRHHAREHEVRVGVLVVDDEQAVLGGALERDEADVVVVVAELRALGVRGLRRRDRTRASRQRAHRPSAAARRRRSLRRRDASRRSRPRPR